MRSSLSGTFLRVSSSVDQTMCFTPAAFAACAMFCACAYAFFITNFWEHFSPQKEYAQAQNMAQAAKAAGVKHIVWSTLEDTRKKVPLSDDRMPTLMEHYKVP